MKKIDISGLISTAKKQLIEHSPEILTGVGIAGMILCTVTAVKVTPKAIKLLEEEKQALKKDTLTPVETVQTVWQCYLVPALSGISGAVCIIFAAKERNKRSAAFAAAYTISETAFKEYKGKVLEKFGEKKEKEVHDEIARDRIIANPPNESEIIFTGDGDTLCYDALTGRYFKSNIDKLKKIENILNLRLREEVYLSLNEFYYEIGLPSVEIGDDLGWCIDDGYISMKFSAQLTDKDIPCIVISTDVTPCYQFAK